MAASTKDVEAVLQLEQAVPEAPHWPKAEYLSIVSARPGAPQRCLLVCRHEAEIVGFSVGKIVASEAELETVVVQPAWRRGGIGRALCEAAIAWAWEQGCSVMNLEVRESSVGARVLYTALGFVEEGRRHAYYSSPADNAVLMCLVRS